MFYSVASNKFNKPRFMGEISLMEKVEDFFIFLCYMATWLAWAKNQTAWTSLHIADIMQILKQPVFNQTAIFLF